MMKFLLIIMIWLMPFILMAADEIPSAPPVSWNDVIAQLSKAVLSVLIPVLVTLVSWALKKILDLIKIGFIRNLAKKWVLSAFQQFTTNTEKYDYVAERMAKAFKYLTKEEIKDYIEEAVAELKIQLNTVAINTTK